MGVFLKLAEEAFIHALIWRFATSATGVEVLLPLEKCHRAYCISCHSVKELGEKVTKDTLDPIL